jgi:pimeloyl-ACP methyl ester carboxylesterase
VSLDDDARQLLAEVMTPRRRARPRIAEPLRAADDFEVATPSGSVAAWRLGAGPAVLCVHGWEDDNALWGPLIGALAEIGVASIALDLPGHGFSAGSSCTPPMAGEAIAAVAAELGPVDAVVTHSFGGPAAGIALARGLNARRVVLIAPPRGRNRRWFRVAEERGIAIEVVERAREIHAEQAGEAARFDFAELAPSLKTEALILHSADDEQVEWDQGRAIADAWPGANFVLCDGLGHRLIAQDRDVIGRIVEFVA